MGIISAALLSAWRLVNNLQNQKDVLLFFFVDQLILLGDFEGVRQFLATAAAETDFTQSFPYGYTDWNRLFAQRSHNVNTYKHPKGQAAIFGDAIAEAKDVYDFRQAYCGGLSVQWCNQITKEAIDYRYTKYYVVAATTAIAGGLRPPSIPRLKQMPGFTPSVEGG